LPDARAKPPPLIDTLLIDTLADANSEPANFSGSIPVVSPATIPATKVDEVVLHGSGPFVLIGRWDVYQFGGLYMRRLMTKPAAEAAPRGGPAPLRWLIGVELARYRNSANLSLTEASQLSGIGRAKLGHLETGRQQQDPDDIARLLADYGAEQADIERLTSLTNQADEARWWAPWAQVVPDWLKTFVGLEGLAESEFVFEPMLIPGLLQTEQYAAAVTANTPRVRADYSERFVGLRIARTRRLTDNERPLQLHAVITESALRLAVGDPALRRAQLRHLLAMARLPTVTIQILRPEDGPHTALTGQFAVLGFANMRSIGYVELHDGAVYLQDAEQVRSYTMVSEDLQGVALDPERSISFIQSVVGA